MAARGHDRLRPSRAPPSNVWASGRSACATTARRSRARPPEAPGGGGGVVPGRRSPGAPLGSPAHVGIRQTTTTGARPPRDHLIGPLPGEAARTSGDSSSASRAGPRRRIGIATPAIGLEGTHCQTDCRRVDCRRANCRRGAGVRHRLVMGGATYATERSGDVRDISSPVVGAGSWGTTIGAASRQCPTGVGAAADRRQRRRRRATLYLGIPHARPAPPRPARACAPKWRDGVAVARFAAAREVAGVIAPRPGVNGRA